MTPKLLLIALVAWAAIAFVALTFVVVRDLRSEPDARDALLPAARPWLPSPTQIVVTGLALVLVAARLMLAGGVAFARTLVTAALVALVVTLLGRSVHHSRTRD